MGDDQGRPAGRQLVEGVLDFRLRHGVQRGGRLVQNQDGRVFQEDTGNGDPLLLPAGKKRTPLAHVGVKAVGHGLNVIVDLRLLGRVDDLLHGGVRLAVADVFQNGVGKQEHVLLDNADVFVDASLGHVPDVQSVNGNRAGTDVVKPGDQLAQCRLTAAGGADDGDRFPGGDGQAHVVKHRQIGVVGKGNMVDPDFTPDVFQFLRVWLILHGGFGAHDLHEAVQARKAVGKRLGEVGELAHGADKRGNIQAEGQQVTVVHFPLHDIITAEADDNDIQTAQKELHAAVEHAHCLVERPLGGFEFRIGRVKTGGFHRLVGEGFRGADAGKAAFNLLIDVADLLLCRGGRPPHPAAHGHCHRQKHRNGQRHDHGKLPANGRHHDERPQNGQHGSDQILGAVVGKLRQLEQIGGQPRHQLTGAVAVIEIHAQLLHMAEQVTADVRLHPDAEGMAVIRHNIIQKRPQNIAHRHNDHDGKERAVHLVGQHLIKRTAGHQREQQVDGRDSHSAGHIGGKQPSMVLEVAQENHQRRFFPIILRRHVINPPFLRSLYMILQKIQASTFRNPENCAIVASPSAEPKEAPKWRFYFTIMTWPSASSPWGWIPKRRFPQS